MSSSSSKFSLSFLMNIAYCPPSAKHDHIVKFVNELTENVSQARNKAQQELLHKAINESPLEVGPCVLYIIQRKLHSTKPEKVLAALELFDSCVRQCSLLFVCCINVEFMRSVKTLAKIDDIQSRSVVGFLRKLTSGKKAFKDPRVLQIRELVRKYIKEWSQLYPDNPLFWKISGTLERNAFSNSTHTKVESANKPVQLDLNEYLVLIEILDCLKSGVNIESAIAKFYEIQPTINIVKNCIYSSMRNRKTFNLNKSDPRFTQLNIINEVEMLVQKYNGILNDMERCGLSSEASACNSPVIVKPVDFDVNSNSQSIQICSTD